MVEGLRRGRSAGRVLVDRRDDRRLRRDGFVKVRLLDRAAAHALRTAYGRLHGWSGDGFQVDFWDDDPTYRREASAAIAAAVDEPLRRLFVDHRPFLRNYLVKWPGERDPQGFPEGPHRDWMYTDERAGHKSYVAWIALEDVTGHNGQLQVARGSHTIDDALRGTNISTPWLDHQEVWAARMLAVPALAGEAIITDAATVHGSYSNLTDAPRVAVAVAMAPGSAPLVHYWRDPSEAEPTATQYVVDDEFFLSQSAPGLLASPPDRSATATVEIGGRSLAPEDLARELDRPPLATLDRLRATRRQARR